jgi:hypothetical protein
VLTKIKTKGGSMSHNETMSEKRVNLNIQSLLKKCKAKKAMKKLKIYVNP